jgi:chromosome segregation ATPase
MSAVEDQQTDTSSKQERLAHERASYQRQLSRCEHDLQRWEAAYLAEVITLEDFRSKKADVETRRASAEQELARLDTEEHMLTQTAETTIAIVAYCQHVGERVAGMSLEEKRLALEALGIVATWHPEKPLDIRGNIPLVIETNASK